MFPWWQLMLWSLALAFLGVFIAVPLRTQTVIKVTYRVSSIFVCHSALCIHSWTFCHAIGV